MKQMLTTFLTTLTLTNLFGQAEFSVEGRNVKAGSIVKTYNFYYQFQDSVSLVFSDSTLTFSNPEKTIVKEVTYDKTSKSPYTRIEYFRTNKEDSISKHFNGDKLSMIYETRFDSLDRKVYYGMKYFFADSTYDPSFEWTYEYYDSLTSTGKISIQTIFVDDNAGDKRFHFRVLSFLDFKNRKIKEVRESQPNDSMAQISNYTYNNNDSLISEKVDGMETLTSKHINTKCDQENEYVFATTDFREIKKSVIKLLNDNKKVLTTKKCENFFMTLISPDKKTRMTIVKRQPYWCEGKRVIFTTTQKL